MKDRGHFFCGADADKSERIDTVKEVIDSFMKNTPYSTEGSIVGQ